MSRVLVTKSCFEFFDTQAQQALFPLVIGRTRSRIKRMLSNLYREDGTVLGKKLYPKVIRISFRKRDIRHDYFRYPIYHFHKQ